MAIRLNAMKRVLKKTGSIYLHCDPTASHYLKMIMDAVFGNENFKNEISWCYKRMSTKGQTHFSRCHDIVFWYGNGTPKFNVDAVRLPYAESSKKRAGYAKTSLGGGAPESGVCELNEDGRFPEDWWEIPFIRPNSKERLGYPTQKPLALLERIIKASSDRNDVVLDPFCGCGTTVHAAESLKRQWIGIDISQFSAGLIRNRLLKNFTYLDRKDIPILGCPLTVADAEDLADSDRFEFEKWACGEVGAQGLYHEPGERGSDGGVDGVIPFYFSKEGLGTGPPEKTFAVLQVKSGKVNPDNVKALSTTVRQSGAKCGVFICFEKYMNTVENNREKKKLKDWTGEFNFIQGLSVERIINGEMPNIPGLRKAA